jgi:protein-S-isoprenylcysteine O-methyltransferase Ste14
MDRRLAAWLEIGVLFVVLYAGVPLAGLGLDRVFGIGPVPISFRILGPILIVVGVVGLAWCFGLFGRADGTPNPLLPPRQLVTTGPYAWTRNPIAGSHFLAVLGLALTIGSFGAVLITFLLGIPANIAIRHEERTLESRFGEEYRRYRNSVPRWVPRPPRPQR